MYKSCSVCGKVHRFGTECKPKRQYKSTDERKLRSSYRWTKKSLEVRNSASYLCEVCRDNGVYTYEGVEVHHIEKIKDNPTLLLDNANLVCLCVEHHKQADNGEIDKEYLRELAKGREE